MSYSEAMEDCNVKAVSLEEQVRRQQANREAPPVFLHKTDNPADAHKNPIGGRDFVLTNAERAVKNDRNKEYGAPEDNFQNIANLWNAYLIAQGKDVQLQNYDVAQFMILMKAARLATNPGHLDSLVDEAGYAACGADCVINRKF